MVALLLSTAITHVALHRSPPPLHCRSDLSHHAPPAVASERSRRAPPAVASELSRRAFALGAAALAGGVVPGSACAAVDRSTPISALQQQERTVEDLFTRATESVVYINTFVARTDRLTMNAVDVPAGTGSGFVWDDAGHIVTNYHVIRGASQAKVGVVDGRGSTKMFGATLVGYNPDKDVAVLKIEPSAALRPIDIGSSSALRVGSTTLAIGNPFGLDHTLTVGVVSGLGREVTSPSGRPISNVIQTDAAINPGNSGGALLDSSGRLIGMNTAIYSPSGASAGIGFAIPADTLKQQVATILRYGKVLRPAIGISFLEAAQARALGVARGVLVLGVPDNSAAAKAGLRPTFRLADGTVSLGDVIVQIDAAPVRNEADLFRALDSYQPGQKVTLTVERLKQQGGALEELQISLPLQAIEAV
mmetsp:Transcript_49315/g.158748  ORF Transcript_49315/g.158748 Transcript_49315/m.158748 type:complete len:420 (+) Transcript_49315:79-1338(+)